MARGYRWRSHPAAAVSEDCRRFVYPAYKLELRGWSYTEAAGTTRRQYHKQTTISHQDFQLNICIASGFLWLALDAITERMRMLVSPR